MRKSRRIDALPQSLCRISGTVREEKGAEVVEFAFIAPLLFTVLIGIFWFARAYNTYETITRAAREGVRFAVAPNCASCGNQLPSDREIQGVISASLKASALDPTRTNPNPVTITRTSIPVGGGAPPDTDVSVSFTYPFQFNVPFISANLTTVRIPTSVHMRQEQ
jgi:Flp pilus assembly protein TadG